ncbi:MAG: phosphoenolpyruvate carboxylase, partial [Stenotrophomonas sp.]
MNEYRSSVVFATPDLPLRDDVRRLGTLVGDLISEQVSPGFLDEVEDVRTAAIARRESHAPLTQLSTQLAGRAPRDAEALVRAFSTYFQVVNIAERVHRIRRRRDYQRAGTKRPQPEGLHDALLALKAQGVTPEELAQWLPRIDIEPVFTAHPTEAVRRALLEKEQLMVAALVDNLDGQRTPGEQAADAARFRMALTASWQTADSSPVRPTVDDEREHVGFYLTRVLYRVIPVFYESLEQALRDTWGRTLPLPRLLRFGTWVGGDMDGNPNVDAGTITNTLNAQRNAVLSLYLKDMVALASLLSQSTELVGVSAEVQARVQEYQQLLPQVKSRPRHADMPYRLLNDRMRARLQATQEDAPGAYASPEEFIHDIQLILDSLDANKGKHAGWFSVRRLLWRVRTFGFHLARLDVRQESSVHSRALAEVLGGQDAFDALDDVARAQLLSPYAAGTEVLTRGEDEA